MLMSVNKMRVEVIVPKGRKYMPTAEQVAASVKKTVGRAIEIVDDPQCSAVLVVRVRMSGLVMVQVFCDKQQVWGTATVVQKAWVKDRKAMTAATKIFAHRVFAAVRRSVSQMIADKGLARRTVHRIK